MTLELTDRQMAVIERYRAQRSIPENAVIQVALDLLEQSERNQQILSLPNPNADSLLDEEIDSIIDAVLHQERAKRSF